MKNSLDRVFLHDRQIGRRLVQEVDREEVGAYLGGGEVVGNRKTFGATC